MLTRLRNTLAGAEHGAAACAKLRERYHVALVDEFQDTDPIQWEILRRAFGEGEATLILIADPKQAIYSFRGADVYAYLSAADSAVTNATLASRYPRIADLRRAPELGPFLRWVRKQPPSRRKQNRTRRRKI